jgi:hypothetical protein
MNIIEAIKSGKKYRQKGERGYYHPPDECSRYTFTLEQILAEDWEFQAITREQFDAVWNKYVQRFEGPEQEAMLKELDLVAKELGL